MKRRAFTLLELILALAITVIIAATLVTALHTAYRAWGSAQRAMVAARTTGIITQIIGRDLENALQPNGILASDFVGSTESLSFYTTTPEPAAAVPGDIKRVEYGLVAGNDGRDELVRRLNTNLLQTIETDPVDEPLCRGVTLLEITYFDGETWTESWDSTAQDNLLPLAVRVSFEIARTSNATPLRCDQVYKLACATTATSGSEAAQ